MKKIDDDELISLLKKGNITQRSLAARYQCSEAAISKRKKKLEKLGVYNESELPESFTQLGDREKKFVVARLGGANQTLAAQQAFECGTHGSARSRGSQLMRRNDIKVAMSELLQERGLSRTVRIDKLKEHLENKDPNTSLKSIEIANKMEGLYGTDKHLHLHTTREDYEVNTQKMSELDSEIKALEAELGIGDGVIDIEPIDGGN